MMKFYLLSLIAVFFITYSSNAQIFQKFDAKAGQDKAAEYAKTTLGFQDPQLKFLGTVKQDIDFNGIKFSVDFDLTTGKSNGWVYHFEDKNNVEKSSNLFAFKTIAGFSFFEYGAVNLADYGLDVSENVFLNDYTVINSDRFVTVLNAFADYKEFYDNENPFSQVAAVLFIGTTFSTSGLPEPYWVISLSNENYRKTCGAQATTEEIFCFPPVPTDVKTLETNFTEVFPNPAGDFVTINYEADSENFHAADIYDNLGRNVLSQAINNGENRLDISALETGVYNVRINNKIIKIIKK